MADGSKKIIAQREYDNKKELAAIDRAKEEYIQKEIQRQKEIFDAEENLKAVIEGLLKPILDNENYEIVW